MERRHGRPRPDQRMFASGSPLVRNIGYTLIAKDLAIKDLARSAGVEQSAFWRIAVGETKNPIIGQVARVLILQGEEEAYRILRECVPLGLDRANGWDVFSEDAPVMMGKFAQQVRGYRELKGNERFDLAALGLTDETMSKMERGVGYPRLSKFVLLVFGLGLNRSQSFSLLETAADEYKPRRRFRHISGGV